MNNSTIEEAYGVSDPISALFLSIWLVFVGIIGIPLNTFIVVATVKVQEIRAVSSNIFIGSLALSDALLMLSLSLHFPYTLTSNETLCKIIGFSGTTLMLLSTCIPLFVALNRYAIVCRQKENLARKMNKAFSRKGTYWMIFLLWTFEILYQLPFILLDTFGEHSIGSCATVKKSTNNIFIRVYYYCGILGILFFSNLPLLVFYRKVSLWVKTMSAQLSLAGETRQTIRDTENVLLLTKWVTVIPIIFTSPATLIAVLFEFNSEIVSVGVARLIISSYPLIPLLNAILTIKFARPYRIAFKKVCDRTKLTSVLFSWMIEGRWLDKVDVVLDNQTAVFAAQS